MGRNGVNGTIENLAIDADGNLLASGWVQENLLIVYDSLILMNSGPFSSLWIRFHSRSTIKLPNAVVVPGGFVFCGFFSHTPNISVVFFNTSAPIQLIPDENDHLQIQLEGSNPKVLTNYPYPNLPIDVMLSGK